MEEPTTEVFISYAVEDKAFVERLAADLQARGMTAWVGHINLRGGQNWPATIEEAIDHAQAVLVVWTPDAKRSQYVQKEYGYAIEQHKRVIPLIVKPCKLTMLLHDLQWMDFTRPKNYSSQFNALVDLLTNDENMILAPQSIALGVPRPLSMMSVAALFIVVVGLGILLSTHGARQTSTPAMSTPTVVLTATASNTVATTTSTVPVTGTVGNAGNTTRGSATATSTTTHPAPTAIVPPTNTPPATPTPTTAPSPTPSPTMRIGQ